MQVGDLIETRSYLLTGEIGIILEIIEGQYKVMLPSGIIYFYENELIPIRKKKIVVATKFYKNLLKKWCRKHDLSLEKCIKQAIYSNDKKIKTIALFTKILMFHSREVK